MLDKQRSDIHKNQHQHQLQLQLQLHFQPVTNSLNVLTCLLVTLLLLFEGHTIQATPITRLRQQQQQQEYQSQSHQQHANHRQQQQHFQERNVRDCEHKSLVELIKTSPIVIKALGAHIFTNDDDEDLHIIQNPDDAFVTSWQLSEQTKFAALHKGTSLPSFSSAESTSSASRGSASTTTSFNADAILITLTPDTIYKGASLLKTATNAAIAATSSRRSGSTNADNSDGANDSDFSPYSSSESSVEGQLNATIQPLSCFDGNLLKTLPTDLIIFGKLITIDQQQQTKHRDLINFQQGYTGTSASSSSSSSASAAAAAAAEAASAAYSTSHQHQQTQRPKDILQISVNGLHRWSSQLESYIWTHLGWDDWSDFTVCSVACGKGVQQRFRRCLLDNPMVNMKMNFNEIAEEELHAEEEALEVEQEVEEYDDNDHNDTGDDGAYADGDDIDANEEKQYDDIDRMIFEDDDDDELIDQLKAIDNYDSAISSSLDYAAVENSGDNTASGNANENLAKSYVTHKKHRRTKLSQTVANQKSILPRAADVFEMDNNMLHFVTSQPIAITKRVAKHQYMTRTTTTTEEPEIMRIFEGDFNDVYSEKIYNESPFNSEPKEDNKKDIMSHRKGHGTKHKRHKSAKIVSTMFCEGYNIEQRDCNTFECSDDINDLLKFYRKYSSTEDTSTASTQPLNADFYTAGTSYLSAASSSSSSSSSSLSLSASTAAGNSPSVPPSTPLINELGTWNSLTETYNQNSNTITPTPINTGFVQSWHNVLNFTIMLTIRAKNDSYNAAAQSSKAVTSTIFSIRNGSQHLYLETYRDGLRLYLERDKTTEMLPIQFNLYDYRWHQVAISIKNGDFISIYIDCSWTNSFVVSSRMFSLPIESDVEIGRGFNGELQQLLILPGLQGRRQCSDKRISINEVKRYIIDTFIGDYGN